MKNNHKIATFLSIFITLIIISSCNKSSFITDNSAKLEFSLDTVIFDTIFTTIGSTTKKLKVYNKHKQPIKISNIELARGKNSKYRLNIDGVPANQISDYELAAEDSLYIFVEVTIDPNQDEMLEHDSIIFFTNGNTQDIDLVSFGQDVHLINGEIIETQTWETDKPYLIYNSVMVDTLHTLTIPAGQSVYFHKNSYLYVLGTLVVEGTLDNPVVFQGDRLEDLYDNWAGQWGGIRFLSGSNNNYINYAEIKNARIGIEVDTLVNNDAPTLFISNSVIKNHSLTGIYALATYIVATNCVIADCGIYNVGLFLGGTYSFFNCTLSNNYKWATRSTPALVFNNYLTVDKVDHFWGPLQAYFSNTIIYGGVDNEFYADAFNIEGGMSYTFDHCLLKLDLKQTDTSLAMFQNCIVNKTPDFVSTEDFDFHLDTVSNAVDKANIEVINQNLPFLQYDLDGNDRLSDEKPDIGAYERQFVF